MTKEEVGQAVAAQLALQPSFENFHGITPANVRSFLVPPYEATVDPDDCENAPRPMWVVLQERRDPAEGYVVVFDPSDSSWGVAEQAANQEFLLVVSGSSLQEALRGM